MQEDSGRVLVVEDDPQVRQLIRLTLERGGYEVVEAEDGKIALSRAAEQEFVLMICDIMLPRTSGVTVIGEVRRLCPDLTIVALTGSGPTIGGGDLVDLLTNAGADAIMHKPFRPFDLLEEVNRLLANGRLSAT